MVKVHTGALTLFLCSRRSFPAVHECTPLASMLRGTHVRPVPADNPHGGPAGRPNRSGPTPSRPVSAVVEGQDERFTREPAYRTCSTPCWHCWYTHVRLEVRAGYEGNYSLLLLSRASSTGQFLSRRLGGRSAAGSATAALASTQIFFQGLRGSLEGWASRH